MSTERLIAEPSGIPPSKHSAPWSRPGLNRESVLIATWLFFFTVLVLLLLSEARQPVPKGSYGPKTITDNTVSID